VATDGREEDADAEEEAEEEAEDGKGEEEPILRARGDTSEDEEGEKDAFVIAGAGRTIGPPATAAAAAAGPPLFRPLALVMTFMPPLLGGRKLA